MSLRPRIYATRALPGEAFAALVRDANLAVWPGPGAPPPARLRAACAEADGLLCLLSDRIDRAFIAACPRLRVISSVSVGVDHVDLEAARARAIPVGHTPGVLTETTADLAFGLLIAVARRIPEAERFLRAGRWTPERAWEPELLLGRDVHGATLGIVGAGAIGRAVARRAEGFGMRVLVHSRTRREVPGAEWCEALHALLAASDFVSLHLALTPETRGLIGRAELAAMPRHAFLINTARGEIVDEAALVDALAAGEIAGAGLDVYAREPLAPGHALLALENVVLLPHVGSASRATRIRMVELAIANLHAGLAGAQLPHDATRR